MTVYDAHLEKDREVHVILSSLMADAPARKMTNLAGGSNSHFPCQWCLNQSQQAGHCLHPGNYINRGIVDKFEPMYELQRSRGVDINQACDALKAKMGHPELKLDDDEQMWRMNCAEEREPNVNCRLRQYGVKGTPALLRKLDYVSYNNVHCLPTYHLLLHGVLKRSWQEFLKASNGMISAGDRRKMAERARGMRPTNDMQ